MKTDTSEKGLESLIVADMTAAGWIPGADENYNREYAVDLVRLHAFVHATQEPLVAALTSTRPGRHDRSSSPAFRVKSPSAA
jgi:type I restriction enzyme R subunit